MWFEFPDTYPVYAGVYLVRLRSGAELKARWLPEFQGFYTGTEDRYTMKDITTQVSGYQRL